MKTLPSRSLVASLILSAALLSGCGATVQGVFTDIQTACVAADLAASVIPPGAVTSVIAQDVVDACDLAVAAIPDVESVIVSFEGQVSLAGDAGTVARPGAEYRQPAWALPKIAAARAHRLSVAH